MRRAKHSKCRARAFDHAGATDCVLSLSIAVTVQSLLFLNRLVPARKFLVIVTESPKANAGKCRTSCKARDFATLEIGIERLTPLRLRHRRDSSSSTLTSVSEIPR
jgi:hypothetical protein